MTINGCCKLLIEIMAQLQIPWTNVDVSWRIVSSISSVFILPQAVPRNL